MAYLDKLRAFPNPWVWEPNYPAFPYARSPVELNPELPQFPEGTKFALLRRMLLIDNRGNLVPTSLTESLQVRVYRIDPETAGYGQDANQDVFDVRLRRKHLFAGRNGGLRAVEPDEKDYSNSIALFSGAAMHSPGSIMLCGSCHAGPGIFSVLTYTRRAGEQSRRTPWLGPGAGQKEAARTIEWKQQQYSWGLLQGLWRNEP